jgi:hypothetical protein
MAGGVLAGGADVDEDQVAGLEAREQLVAIDVVDVGAVAEVGVGERVEVVELFGGELADGQPDLEHLVGGEPVVDVGALAAGGHQPGPGEGAQVVGGVGDRLVDLVGELLDAALALGEDLDDLGAPSGAQGGGDAAEAVEQCVLGGSAGRGGRHELLLPSVPAS